MRIIITVAVLFCSLLFSCDTIERYDKLEASLSEDKFIDVLSDILIAQNMPFNTIKKKTLKDSLRTEEISKVLAFHQVEKEVYESSAEVYFKQFNKTPEMMAKLTEALQKKETKYLEFRADKIKSYQDTTDIKVKLKSQN